MWLYYGAIIILVVIIIAWVWMDRNKKHQEKLTASNNGTALLSAADHLLAVLYNSAKVTNTDHVTFEDYVKKSGSQHVINSFAQNVIDLNTVVKSKAVPADIKTVAKFFKPDDIQKLLHGFTQPFGSPIVYFGPPLENMIHAYTKFKTELTHYLA
jgi:hypothetical protein